MSPRGRRAALLALAALFLVGTAIAYFDPFSWVSSPAVQRAVSLGGLLLTLFFGVWAVLPPTGGDAEARVEELRKDLAGERAANAARQAAEHAAFLDSFNGGSFSGEFEGTRVHLIWDGALGRINDERPQQALSRDKFRWIQWQLWTTSTTIKPLLDTPGLEQRAPIYETDEGRTFKRQLRGFGTDARYVLYAVPRAGAATPRFCGVCHAPDMSGANNCPTYIQEGRGTNPL
jgi:hypothetical protein